MLRWMHRIRLYPTPTQVARLEHALHLTRNLWNAALDQRRYEYRAHRRHVTAKMQYAELTDLRADSPGDAAIYRECQDAVLHRLDLAMAAFFRRVKGGETPGFPRFKNDMRWNQLEYPHGDRAIKLDARQAKARIPGVGSVRVRKGREIPQTYGRAFVVRKNGKWYAVFECKREVEPMPATGRLLGEEPGRNVAAKSGLNRALLDTGFGTLRQLIVEKAAWAARLVAVVDPRYTSQTCFACKAVAARSRKGTRFVCVGCGHRDHADVNAARNILAKAEWPPPSVLSSGDARLTRHDAA